MIRKIDIMADCNHECFERLMGIDNNNININTPQGVRNITDVKHQAARVNMDFLSIREKYSIAYQRQMQMQMQIAMNIRR